ncbi:MAG: ABC transporter substrate-binding protein, partial [Brooklawnia sp.]
MRRVLLTILAAIMGLALLTACEESAGAQVHLGESVKIGLNLELSGSRAELGDQSLKGAQLAVNQLNESGGVLGKPIELVVADNASDGGRAVAVSMQLMTKEKVLAILGPASNPLFALTNTVAAQQEVPQVSVAACSQATMLDEDGQLYPYSFRTCTGEDAQGRAMARFASQNLAATQALVLKLGEAQYATDLATGFTEVFTEAEGAIIGTEDFVADQDDLSGFVDAAAGAEVVFIAGPAADSGRIIKALRDGGVSAPVVGSYLFDNPAFGEAAGAGMLDDVYHAVRFTQFDTSNSRAQDFVEAFGATYDGATPSVEAALAYDAMLLITDSIARAAAPTGVEVREAMASTTGLSAATGQLSIGSDQQPRGDTMVIKL